MTQLDQSVLEWFLDRREPWLTTMMRAATTLGGSAFLIPLVLVVGAWYWRRHGTRRPLALLVSAYAGGWVLSHTIKTVTDRARPPAALALGSWDTPAFPSGHATHAAAVWGMLAVVAAATTAVRRRQVVIWVTAVAIIAAVGITRLYLAAHWLTDVLAGWTIGALWVVLVLALYRSRAGPVLLS